MVQHFFYNFGRSKLIQSFEKLNYNLNLKKMKVFKWTFSNRHFLNTYYLKADWKGSKRCLKPFPSDLPCTAFKTAEYLFDVNCWISQCTSIKYHLVPISPQADNDNLITSGKMFKSKCLTFFIPIIQSKKFTESFFRHQICKEGNVLSVGEFPISLVIARVACSRVMRQRTWGDDGSGYWWEMTRWVQSRSPLIS